MTRISIGYMKKEGKKHKVNCESRISNEPKPIDVVQWLTLLLRIWEIPGSDLGLETGYSEFFEVYLSPPGRKR
jgi:hypothetical protein